MFLLLPYLSCSGVLHVIDQLRIARWVSWGKHTAQTHAQTLYRLHTVLMHAQTSTGTQASTHSSVMRNLNSQTRQTGETINISVRNSQVGGIGVPFINITKKNIPKRDLTFFYSFRDYGKWSKIRLRKTRNMYVPCSALLCFALLRFDIVFPLRR